MLKFFIIWHLWCIIKYTIIKLKIFIVKNSLYYPLIFFKTTSYWGFCFIILMIIWLFLPIIKVSNIWYPIFKRMFFFFFFLIPELSSLEEESLDLLYFSFFIKFFLWFLLLTFIFLQSYFTLNYFSFSLIYNEVILWKFISI